MPVLHALLQVVLPVVLVAGVGALWSSRTTVDQGTISRISLHVLTPALSAEVLLTTEVSADRGLRLVLAFTLATLLAAALGLLVGRGLAPATRRSVSVATAIGNNGNMGLPVALFALGRAGFDQAVLLMLASVVITFVLAPLLYGELSDEHDALSALLAGLPAGTVSGAPKVRAMEIID